MKIGLFVALSALFFLGCNRRVDAEPERFLRLDRAVETGVMPDSVMALGWGDMSAAMAGVSLEEYSASPAVKVFQPDVERILPSLDSVELVVGGIRASLSVLLPEVKWERTYAMTWPYDQSVVYGADGNLLVALNQYLGADYPGYVGRYPEYLAVNKRPEMMPVDIAEALLQSSYPYEEPESGLPALINRMMHDGAIAHVMKRSLPQSTPLSTILGLSDNQTDWLEENEAAVWRAMMEAQLVYNTDSALAARLLRRAPSSPAISQSAPGQTARFIGLRIVESYVKNHPDVSADFLLSPEFYNSNQSLIQSKYAPN